MSAIEVGVEVGTTRAPARSTLDVDWTLRDQAPERAFEHGRPLFGRYRRPLRRPDVDLAAPRFRLKEWCYMACTTPECFFALGMVQLGYAAQLFSYLVDRRTGKRTELERMAPLGGALEFAPGSLTGRTRWRSRRVSVEAGFDGSHVLHVDLPLGRHRLVGELRMEPDDALALLFPLDEQRPAYTHKASGMRAHGGLRWGSQHFSLEDGLGTLDWTRSLANRHTVWNWASFAGRSESGKRFGLNLSARVYDQAGASLENAVWFDGRVQVLGGVRFEVPARTTDAWRIVSNDGSGEVELEIKPWGERRARMELGVLRSVFVQPYGLASGTIAGERISNVFGVVEDHDSLW